MIGVGIAGLGFMGRTHVEAYRALGSGCEVVAVCDPDPARRVDGAAWYADFGALLGDERVSAVSVCTHTDLHVPMASAALAAGKHVLVEKPVALEAGAVRALADEARGSGKLCVPAMCVRFWPAYAWLAQAVRAGRYGGVRSAVFRRLSPAPDRGGGFYSDRARSGGALFDLHIHDADFVYHLFGRPCEVVSAGSVDHVTTLYRFAGGPGHVVAEGGWDHAPGFEFRMSFVVVLEGATAAYDGVRLVLSRDGKSETVALPDETGWTAEVRAFVRAIATGDAPVTMDEAAAVTEVLEAERLSLETGRAVGL